MMSPRSRPSERRRGVVSLIEALVSMTMIAVLFGTTATLTTLVFRLERLGRDDLAATLTEGRLASEFRSDVHQAMQADIDDATCSLIGPGDRRVVYQVREDSLIRRMPEDEGPDRVEAFRFKPGTLARWEWDESIDDRRRLVLTLDPPPVSDGHRRPFRVEATVGRDHRYEGDGS